MNDPNVHVIGDTITYSRGLSTKFGIFNLWQYRQSLVQKANSDPIAIPKPIPQISMPGAVAHLIFNNA
jgi:hypothetical protein